MTPGVLRAMTLSSQCETHHVSLVLRASESPMRSIVAELRATAKSESVSSYGGTVTVVDDDYSLVSLGQRLDEAIEAMVAQMERTLGCAR